MAVQQKRNPIDYADRLWSTLEERYPFLREMNTDITEKRKQLKNKEVIISVFGRHNCGKSTLLNALLGNKLLPTNIKNETCVEIKIRHDATVHPGHCGKDCQRDDCPRLEEENLPINKTIAKGAVAIKQRLSTENAYCRQTGLVSEGVRKVFIIFTYVPILAGSPDGWTVTLVDTPGFGEANVDEIMKHADMLFNTSAGYLYLMDCTSLEDNVDSDNIQVLFKRDKDVFKDGKIIVCVNKYDQHLSQQNDNLSRDGEEMAGVEESIRSLKQSSLSFITNTVNCPLPSIEIVPMSADWADKAVWLRADPNNRKLRKKIDGIIEEYDDFQAYGEGEGDKTAEEMASALEKISGITILDKRLREMIEKCIHIWKNSLALGYTEYLQCAQSALETHHKELQEHKERVRNSQLKVQEYNDLKEKLIDLHNPEEGTIPQIVQQLTEAYKEHDLPPAMGTLHQSVEDRLNDDFIPKMKKIVRKLSPDEFEKEVKTYVKEEIEKNIYEEQLSMTLDGVKRKFQEALQNMEKLETDIERVAKDIIPPELTPSDEELHKSREDERKMWYISAKVLRGKELTIGDLHQCANAPEIKAKWLLGKFWNSLKRMLGGKVHYSQWTDEMDEMMEELKNQIKDSVKNYLEEPLQEWVVEVLTTEFRNKVKDRCQALLGTFEAPVREAKNKIEEESNQCASELDIENIREDIQQLTSAISSLREPIPII